MQPDHPWHQHKIHFADRETAKNTIVERIAPTLLEAETPDELTTWWFMNKHLWLLRYRAPTPSARITSLLNQLADEGIVLAWTRGHL